MYLYRESFVKSRDKSYANIDLSRLAMKTIMNDFIDGYLVLEHTILKGKHYLTLEALRTASTIMDTSLTLEDWLSVNRNIELPTITDKPKYEVNTVKYSDAILAGWKVNLIGRYKNIEDNIPKADLVDMLLQKNMAIKEAMYKNMLVTVNGFLHRHIPHEDGVTILNGGETFNNCGYNTVGILSFYKVANIEQIPITPTMIDSLTDPAPIKDRVTIKVGQSLVGKRVLVSIGGYLITDNRVVNVTNNEEGLIQLKLSNLDLIKMMYHSIDSINLDSIGVFPLYNKNQYRKLRVADILSDTVLTRYLSLPQSFIITVEADDLDISRESIHTTGVPAYYESTINPIYPLVTSLGRLPEYWKKPIEDVYAINLSEDITKRRIYDWNVDYQLEHINAISPTHKWYHDKPNLLIIKTIKKLQ